MTATWRVAVVGAGPSGLTAAVKLGEIGQRAGRPIEVVVLESAARPGGAIGTDEREGFLVEHGADGFITDKPALIELAGRLKIADRLIRTLPTDRGASIVRDGRLVPIPDGFSMMAPTRLRPFLRSPLLSPAGRLRALGELLLPRAEPAADESLASFVRRRFGAEVLERLAQPLVGGIYGADPELLSLRATMPRFLDEERASRSVTLGLRRKARAAQGAALATGARYGLFASFDRGMQVLVDALVQALPAGALHLSTAVQSLTPLADGGVELTLSTGARERFDRVILAVSSRVTARLLDPLDPLLAHRLASISHGSCATVNLAYARRFPAVNGYGVVIPKVERREAIALTFASRKWAARAPADGELIRVFLGDEAAERLDDEALVATARRELQSLLGITLPPTFAVVRRYVAAMPHYHVGHPGRVAAIEHRAAALPWLQLAGNALHGVGLPDAARAGERAAQRAAQEPDAKA